MNIDLFLFSLFSLLSIVSSIFVISLQNAVQSVLFLVLTFCNVACLMLLLGVEFLAFLLIIVYVGAIAVLFLFVIMMLNIKINVKYSNFFLILLITLVILLFFVDKFNLILNNFDFNRFCTNDILWTSWLTEKDICTNIEVIGNAIYTYYSFLFIISGLVLLVAMIGVIVLTLHQRDNLKKQLIEFQLVRNPKDTIKFLYLRK